MLVFEVTAVMHGPAVEVALMQPPAPVLLNTHAAVEEAPTFAVNAPPVVPVLAKAAVNPAPALEPVIAEPAPLFVAAHVAVPELFEATTAPPLPTADVIPAPVPDTDTLRPLPPLLLAMFCALVALLPFTVNATPVIGADTTICRWLLMAQAVVPSMLMFSPLLSLVPRFAVAPNELPP